MSHRIHISPAGDGERLQVVDAEVVVKVPASATADQYELFELTGGEGSGAPLSRHPWAEIYYVLEGDVVVQVGARSIELTAGGCVTIPPLAAHALEIVSGSARLLVVSASAAGSRFFSDMDAEVHLADGPEVFVPRIIEVAARHDVTLLAAAPN
ncbi:MAG: cupin domain-containing protein [Acidimicrobiales bacterium]